MRSSEARSMLDGLSSHGSGRSRTNRRRIPFGLGALLVLSWVLLVSPQAAPDHGPWANETKASLNQQTQVRGRSLMAAYWTIAEGFQSSLMLTNTSEDLLRITPEVYSLTGQKLEMPEIKLGPHQRMSLDMRTWLTNAEQRRGEPETRGHSDQRLVC